MNTEDFIEILKELVKCYESSKPGSPIHKEMDMWRSKFLKYDENMENLEIENAYSAYCVRSIFKSSPSYEMLKKSPEELLNEIIENYRKDNK